MPERPAGSRPTVVGSPDGPEPPFPIHLSGPVVQGFGRGSAELGIPTANIPIAGLSVGGHDDMESGIYYGWCGLNVNRKGEQGKSDGGGTVFEMVMSIGWNPFYGNSKRSVVGKISRVVGGGDGGGGRGEIPFTVCTSHPVHAS